MLFFEFTGFELLQISFLLSGKAQTPCQWQWHDGQWPPGTTILALRQFGFVSIILPLTNAH
eukprot:scaffold248503_cov50-Cyclotella_meneghiniana.AAC.1